MHSNVWFTASFQNNANVMNYAVDKFYALNAELEDLLTAESGFNTLCMFQPISKSIVDKGVRNGGNIFGLERYTSDGSNGMLFLATLAVNGADQEALALPLMRDYTADVEAFARAEGVYWDWKFPNYAHSSQDPVASFGAENVAKLRAASAAYDPLGVFQRLRTTGFHIPE